MEYNGDCTMVDIEKCIAYFEEPDFERRFFIMRNTSPTFKVPNKSMIRDFLFSLGYIEYELVTTYGYECNSLYKGLNQRAG